MERRVVITGIGMITPAGIGSEPFERALFEQKLCIRPIERFDREKSPVKVAGDVRDFAVADFLPMRVAKRSDRFSHLALAASDLAIRNAGWELDDMERSRIGVVVGNNLGGWEFGERGLYELYRKGADSVSPYQASAWFPAAPQGQISIRHRLTGYSKTIVADRAGGLAALALAVRLIRMGRADCLLAGGTEAPLSPYAVLCYLSAGGLSTAGNPETAFLPFDRRRTGMVLAEGAVFLTLEEYGLARERGANILAEIVSYSVNTDPQPAVKASAGPRALTQAMTQTMNKAGWRPADIDLISADGSGMNQADQSEAGAIKAALEERCEHVPVFVPKAGIGHMLGAAGPADVVAVLATMKRGKVPSVVGYGERDDACPLPLVTSMSAEHSVRRALINAQGKGGVAVCLGLAAPGL